MQKPETYIANIRFMQNYLGTEVQSEAQLRRYKVEALKTAHDELAQKYLQKRESTPHLREAWYTASFIAEKIMLEVKSIKDGLEGNTAKVFETQVALSERYNRVLNVGEFFHAELEEAGFGPTIIEACDALQEYFL